jgi:hypothetical protein
MSFSSLSKYVLLAPPLSRWTKPSALFLGIADTCQALAKTAETTLATLGVVITEQVIQELAVAEKVAAMKAPQISHTWSLKKADGGLPCNTFKAVCRRG